MFVVIFCVFLMFNIYNCFNIDVNSPIVYVDPLKNLQSSYFGYSLVLHPGSATEEPWILIGAPRGNSPKFSSNPGVGFKCGIMQKCNILDSFILSSYNFPKNNSWIGGSMDISQNRIVTCAPRQIKYNWKGEVIEDYYLQGACYLFHINDSTTQKLFPLEKVPGVTFTGKTTVYNSAYGQVGFSVHLPISKQSELLLGAPGFLNWRGTSVLCKDSPKPDPIASRLISRQKRDINEFGNIIVADANDNDDYGLLGYSSTSGHFFSDRELYYVSGAPRAHSYHGEVLVYSLNEYSGEHDFEITLHGAQLGEYFGASLTAGDINQDGFDDLIVGAPFHVVEKYNEGRIYIYMGGPDSLNPPLHINGLATNGQFGTCVQFLGDINSDGFGDVAIAAPYEEENRGVVYLFAGSRSGLELYQRIAGKDISSTIRGFGISISKGADVDRNTYPDVAIGAYLSGHVVLLRTNPVVSITHNLESLVSNLSPEQTAFKMRACYSFKAKKFVSGIAFKRTLAVDVEFGRARLQNVADTKTVNLGEAGQQLCENFTLILEKSSNTFDPITVSLTHEFIKKEQKKGGVFVDENGIVGNDYFCPRCPVYNKAQSSKMQKVEIPYVLGCGSDNICNAKLEFESSIIGIKDDTFVLGSKDLLILETYVKNFGEKAYLTRLEFLLPENIYLDSTPSACVQQNRSLVICNVDSPLEKNVKKLLRLPLDVTTINEGKYDGDSLDFIVMVTTSSNNLNENVKTLQLRLHREADVTISGKSEEQSYYYGDKRKPVNFVQSYQIEKFGSSTLNEVLVEIDIPRNISTESRSAFNFTFLKHFTAMLDDQQLMCTESGIKNSVLKQNNDSRKDDRSFYIDCNRADVECSKLICSVSPLASGQIATIQLKMVFDVSLITDLLGANDVIYFGTRGFVKVRNPRDFVQSGDRPDVVEIVSLFVGEAVEEKVAVWIIVVSVLASLIILAICVYVLYRVGFFKRTVKEELEQIKNQMESNESDSLKTEEDVL